MVIMAVDNSLPMLSQLANCLRKAFPTATIVTFTDPHKAVSYSFAQSVDAMFSYVTVGDMDVMALSERVRMNSKDVKLYLVAEQEVLDEAIPWWDITGFLPRPVSVETLRQIAMWRAT